MKRKIRIRVIVMVLVGWVLTVTGCGRVIPAERRVVLPVLPEVWEAVLGTASWRLEWTDNNGAPQTRRLAAGESIEIRLAEAWASPVLAWPCWPAQGLEAGYMRPAGAIFPFDAAGGDIQLRWQGGAEALFWKELAAITAGSTNGEDDSRAPVFLDWLRLRENLAEWLEGDRFDGDPWNIDWRKTAERTAASGFGKTALILRKREAVEIDTGAPAMKELVFIGPSPFGTGGTPDRMGRLTLQLGEATETWKGSDGRLLRANRTGFVWIRG